MKKALALSTGLLALTTNIHAEEQTVKLDTVSIIGTQEEAQQVAGSAHVIGADELAKFEYTDIQRVLASVPGVSFRNEDGYGLRPNISIRGTQDDRSGKITLMEDGVLIAPAPYSASSAYYFPTMGRISGVEVMKGASAIKNGPYTIGGALNLLSTPIPYEQSGKVNLEYGTDNTARAHGWVGDSKDNYGWMIEGQKHQSDGFATIENASDDTGFDKEDVVGKFRVNTDRSASVYQQLDLKLQYSTELSDQTYVGLTEADFKSDPHNRYGLTQEDQMDNEHKEITLTHLADFGETQLQTTGYYIEFKRDWFKVDKINGQGINAVIDLANGGDANAIAILNGTAAAPISIKHNNREYESKGIQTKLTHQTVLAATEHNIEVGLRYHEDQEARDQFSETWNQDASSNMTHASNGASDTRLTTATAWSAYIADDISFDKFVVSPGVRFEDYTIEREASATNKTDQEVTLFGLGATYQVNDALSVFGGVHEGHSPAPNDGKSDPEEALNTEIGTRFVTQNLYAEVTGFYSDYSNLLGACTNSTGSNCTIGDASNGGKATIQGLEVLSNYTQVLTAALNLPVGLTYTYTDGTFDSSFADAGVWGTVTKGDRMPSLSEHQLQLRAGLAHASGWGVDMNINYFSDTCSTAACGVNEGIDAYTVVDLAGRFQATKQLGFYASVDNIFNSEDVVARAPKNGARAQKPLSALVGVNFNF